ncbi:hypothetical protein [Cohnella sp. GCM10027633]|uniref:BC1872 family protein n=1 Tax=unclassified Cohnella TaxID=2636738 RepID=UPI00364038CF
MNIEKLSREQILSMPAGREMDKLVAEKVMGYEWVNPPIVGNYIEMPYAWDKENDEPFYSWYPSSEISTAFEAVKKMNDYGYDFAIESDTESGETNYHCRFFKRYEGDYAEFDSETSFAHAISVAALLTTIQGEENR